ncbi:MAG: hypothetical protein HOC71_07175 [Candidatus Latescibacteria bacterium]|nr:hypothetical protein [Candidatus Latescibacterota bacterium]
MIRSKRSGPCWLRAPKQNAHARTSSVNGMEIVITAYVSIGTIKTMCRNACSPSCGTK